MKPMFKDLDLTKCASPENMKAFTLEYVIKNYNELNCPPLVYFYTDVI